MSDPGIELCDCRGITASKLFEAFKRVRAEQKRDARPKDVINTFGQPGCGSCTRAIIAFLAEYNETGEMPDVMPLHNPVVTDGQPLATKGLCGVARSHAYPAKQDGPPDLLDNPMFGVPK